MVVDMDEIEDSESKRYKMEKVTSLCRCGKSENKPYCDGTHRDIEFKG
ncbi:CDGSH iron-sulfur domain-containing protein [Peptoclostridium litorale]|nr:CDGSH iron-sulfur domain-containing protein [Peptoclostridium litorale]